MVSSATSFTGSGLRDWLWQRLSSLVLAAYMIFMAIYFLWHPHLDFATWQALFECNAMRVFTLITLLSLVIHAWVGIWTVLTDYVKNTFLCMSANIIVLFVLFASLIWGAMILWGVV